MQIRQRSFQTRSSDEYVRDTHGALRAIGIVGLLGVGLIHLLDLPATMHETTYIAGLYVLLIAASVLTAAMLVHRPIPAAWALAAVVAAAPLIAFIINRTVGLPNATDEIGEWFELLGLASLFIEGIVVCGALWAIWLLRSVETEVATAPSNVVDRPTQRRPTDQEAVLARAAHLPSAGRGGPEAESPHHPADAGAVL